MSEKNKFVPQWNGCVEIFNKTGALDSFQSAQVHYKKHVIVGKEWGYSFPFEEYIPRAKNHLNATDENAFVEFCQLEDDAVVKCNLDTLEIGIAQKDTGRIKTFFCSDTIDYIYRKLDNGLWSSPSASKDSVRINLANEFDDDKEKNYLFNKVIELSLNLSLCADNVLMEYIETGNLNMDILIQLVADLGKARYFCYELYSRILTEDQANTLHTIRKKFLKSEVIFEVIEQKVSTIAQNIEAAIQKFMEDQKNIWINSFELISSLDDLELALDKRDNLSYLITELKILKINDRFSSIDIDTLGLLVFKNDIYLKKTLYIMVDKYAYKNTTLLVYPEDFFWRKI